MSKNLVVCCDGTWNDPDEQRHHEAKPTNVAKLALTLASDFEGDGAVQPRQLVHYEKGVGTSARERLIGGGFGYGLSRNIRNGYRFLAEHYDPGDRVYLFGFSRGAYTARSLAGLIHNCGILRRECVGQVDAAFAFYRDRTNRTRPKTIAAQLFRERYSHADSEVYFTGVWDTVGALGIPAQVPGWKGLSKVFTGWKQMWGFHDTRLGPRVSFAYQALAIDEQRPPYEPTLWLKDKDADETQKLEQVWFAGVHSEIGGGTIDSSLSDIPFLWMLEKACAAEVRLKPGQPHDGFLDLEVPAAAPNYAAPIDQSRRGLWRLLRPYHRLTRQSVKSVPGQSIATSADRRFKEKIGGYSPQGFEEYRATFPTTPVPESAPPA
ncbi:MAG TPA: DUF2235 domain-containing protein [Solirubrobacteraceae bacterium]|nr:DUF2235 domain-containing protein [Solirubrobacteraceae bacterium]